MSKKVKFILSADIVADATEGLLLGEFNNWDKDNGFTLKKAKDGSLQTTVSLEPGKTYEYRYLLSDGRWVNDVNAQHYASIPALNVENCVITVPEEVEAIPVKAKVNGHETAPTTTLSEAVADELTKIEGIGKKTAELLQTQNIVSFTDLSKASVKKLKTILENGGSKFKMFDPTSWPKQAKLAAAGKWDELKKLQAELKGGK